MEPFPVPEDLRQLGNAYQAAGHEIVLVGGCVRDHVLGLPCKDVDLATSANPEEQVEICERTGLRWFGTGLKHGTITVFAGGEPYEITTYRDDVETDGRHAVVRYSRDLSVDLNRRDLTINAIAMGLDGQVTDPHGGVSDALAARIRFVGDAETRITEDYLRILRYFRFLGRFSPDLSYDEGEMDAVRRNVAGLARISVERIWSETSRILSGPNPAGVVALMDAVGVLEAVGAPVGATDMLAAARSHTDNPAILMGAWQGQSADGLLERWKASGAERSAAAFVGSVLSEGYDRSVARLHVVDGKPVAAVSAALRTLGLDAEAAEIDAWEVPAMPVQGRDLATAGVPQGRELGERLRRMRGAWIASDYAMGRDELMLVD